LLKPLKNNKALSPVIAAIILIAVVVAVSIAAATWMGSISFSFMKVDELTVSSHTWASGNTYIDLVLKNLGTTTVTISEVQVDDVAVTTVTFPSGNATLGAGGTSILRVIHSFTSAAKHEFTIITVSGTKCVYIASATSVSQLDWTGDGSDGPLLVSSVNQIVNDYTSLTGNENAGDTTITVSDTSGFAEDDEILYVCLNTLRSQLILVVV
jgi:flagellin-like protein